MAEYAPLRDAFHELNRLLIDKQQWDAEHELRKENQGIQRLQVESQLQDAALRREGLKKQAMMDKMAMEVVPVNIYDYTPNSDYSRKKLFADSDSAQRFAKAMGGEGASVDEASGMVRDANGEFVRGPRAVMEQKASLLYGLLSSAYDPEEMINENITAASSKVGELEVALKSTPIHDVAGRKKLQEQISEAKTTLNQHTKMLDPKNLEIMYRQKIKFLDDRSIRAAAAGVDPHILQQYQNAAQRANQDLINIQTRGMQKEMKETELAFRKEDKAEERALRKEMKEAELANKKELAELKLLEAKEKGKGEKTQHHYIVQEDKNGKVVDSAVLAVPKDGRGYLPEEVDPRFKREEGWKYAKQTEIVDREERGAGTKNIAEGTANTVLENMWKVPVMDAMKKTTYTLPLANKPRLDASIHVLGKLLPQHKGNVTTAASEAFRVVKSAEKSFWKVADIKLAEATAKYGTLTPKQRDTLVEALAKDKDLGFYDDLGYVPSWDHRKSLDYQYTGDVGVSTIGRRSEEEDE